MHAIGKTGMNRHQKRLRIACVLGLTAIVIGPSLYHRGRVDYHRARLQLAMEQKLADAWTIDSLPVVRSFFPPRPPYVNDIIWESEQAAKHRAALVELGELETERFVLEHLKAGSPEGRDFTKFLWEKTQLHDVHWESPGADQQVPLAFNFWSAPGGMEIWRRFFAQYDVPNYWDVREQAVVLPAPVNIEM